MEALEKFLGSKTFKFLFAVALVASVALFVGKLSAELWVDLMKWLGGYGAGRGTFEHIDLISKKKKDEIDKTVTGRTDAQLAGDIVGRTGG